MGIHWISGPFHCFTINPKRKQRSFLTLLLPSFLKALSYTFILQASIWVCGSYKWNLIIWKSRDGSWFQIWPALIRGILILITCFLFFKPYMLFVKNIEGLHLGACHCRVCQWTRKANEIIIANNNVIKVQTYKQKQP